MISRRKPRHNWRSILLRAVVVVVIMGGGLYLIFGEDIAVPHLLIIGSGDKISSRVEMALDKVGSVLGERVRDKFKIQNSKSKVKNGESQGSIKLKIALISDSQGNSSMLGKVLESVKQGGVDLIAHLGDFSEGGEREFFRQAKDLLDSTEIEYYVIAGDHDFNWEPRLSRDNFLSAFGLESIDRLIEVKGVKLIFWDNADRREDEKPVDIERRRWLKERLAGEGLVFFFAHRPLASPYFPNRVDPFGQDVLKLLSTEGVGQVFSGDTHSFARYRDQETDMELTTVGAAGTYKNFLPMWVLVTVYEDNTFDVEPRPLIDLSTR